MKCLKPLRLRISEVVDDDQQTTTDPAVFQYVRMGEQVFHVPNLQYSSRKFDDLNAIFSVVK